MKSHKCFKPKVGQILYSLNIGNASRNYEQKLTKVIVTKVGRKYFTCAEKVDSFWTTVYHLDDWCEKTEYSARSSLYSSSQEWKDEKEERLICVFIEKSFTYGQNNSNISLENLRKIESIINGT